MARKKDASLEQPVTKKDFVELTDVIREVAGELTNKIGRVEERLDGVEGKLESVEGRLENVEGRFEGVEGRLGTLEKKVDMNTAAILALDKRVRYQDDMPERLEHVENQQYELTRRVVKLEAK